MSQMVKHLLFSIALALVAGSILGPRIVPIGEIGILTIKLLKLLATPLLFFGIVDTFCKTRIGFKDGLRLLQISFLNAFAALVISLVIAHSLPLERFIDFHGIQSRFPKSLATHPVPAFSSKFFDSVIPVVLVAILLGTSIRMLGADAENPIVKFFERGYFLIQRILGGVVRLIPIAVFCVVAKIVGSSGFALFPALGVFVVIVLFGMLLQVAGYYSALLRFFGISPFRFFRDGAEALLTAFSTGSSLATLPVTLNTLQTRRGIEPKFARLAAAVGTNLNHDGILLYEATAALFVARIYGIELSLPQQVMICATSVIAAIGIAGIPEAGLITLSLVLSAAGLPLEAVAFLLPVDWFIGRLRATTNVASDMAVAHVLSSLETQKATAGS